MEKNEAASVPTAFLVDLVSNRKIPITTPRCRVGRDDLNDIVISGDQSISRFHFIITYENGQYQTQDAKSRHGTFLNGNQIGGPEPINDGDVLKIGVSLFWFVIESQAGAEKDEPLPPVDVEKAPGADEVSLKKGGDRDHAYSGELEMSATQEISIISPEQLAQYSLTKQAEENEFEAKHDVEPIESEKASGKAADEEKSEKSDSEKKDDEAKSESKSDADTKESKDEPAKSSDVEESKSDESKKSDEDDEDKAPKSESNGAGETSAEPTKDDASESKSDEISNAVKDLLEPLQDEIAASREMIRDALKKGEMSFDTEESKKDEDEKKEPEQTVSEEEKPEPAKDDDAKSTEGEESSSKDEEDEKKEESSQPQSEAEETKPEPESSSDKESEEPESSAKKDKGEDEKSEEAETLERIAEIIDDSTAKSELAEQSDENKAGVSADRIETTLSSDHDKATNGFSEDIGIVMGPSSVPDWCKRYFSDELKHLNKELDTLNDQIKQYQDKIRKIENQAAQTKGLRNTLLTADGDDLIEACKQVLSLSGWKVTQSEEDKHEFLLEREDEKVAIARVISIKGSAERSHLGQLSISQTRFWCEKGIEPKGVLIVGRISDKSPKDRGDDTNAEVNEYANMKNVCLMNTLQLLAIYRDLALKDGKSSELRSAIHDSKGWLKGFDLEPGDDIVDEEDKEGTKSKSLSSLLSA